MSATRPQADEFVKQYASNIQGKVILVTGVSPGGLGALFVQKIANAQPKLIILAGRTLSKIEETATTVSVPTRPLVLDLASFESVRRAAEEVKGYEEDLDVLVNNAGIMATAYKKTVDGHENQLQSNHLGHFLFTNLIIDKLLAKPGSRIVSVASDGYRLGAVRYYDYHFHDGESYNPWVAYGQSKTAQLLFSRSLALKYASKGLLALTIHPAVYWSKLGAHLEGFDGLTAQDRLMGHEQGWGGLQWWTESEAVASHTYASFAPELIDHNGAYIEESAVMPLEKIHPWGYGDVEANKCWELSEKLVGQKF